MTANAPLERQTPPLAAPAADRPLDEVMLAMDVVDTLRHRERIVARELDAEAREIALIGRLREIYRAQGIEVPDAILRDGVKALEEQRFVYKPPPGSLTVSLARLYVSRSRWMKPFAGAIAGLVALAGAYQVGYVAPRAAEAERVSRELSEVLPARLSETRGRVQELARDAAVRVRAEALYQDGLDAASDGDQAKARAAAADLDALEARLRSEYVVRVVSRPGEYSGVFRIPDATPSARNYYLIVEAVDAAGRTLPVTVVSEEDQQTKTVSKWGVRVPQSVFERVAADKSDDQIIQDAQIGLKERGALDETWLVDGVGGAILDW